VVLTWVWGSSWPRRIECMRSLPECQTHRARVRAAPPLVQLFRIIAVL
jgi:hypothetical protein